VGKGGIRIDFRGRPLPVRRNVRTTSACAATKRVGRSRLQSIRELAGAPIFTSSTCALLHTGRVRPDRRWQLEAIALLLIGICLSIVAGTGAVMLLKQQWPDLPSADERFYTFLLSGVFFQGLALALVHHFLRLHAVSWREFLGIVPVRPFPPGAEARTGEDPDSVLFPPAPPEADRAADWGLAVLLGLGTAVMVLPGALALNELSKVTLELFQDEVAIQPTLQVLHVADSVMRRVFFGFSAIVLAPLVEEILFRGIAFKAIYERGYRKLAVLVTSVVFGIIHLNLMTFLPLTFFAIVLALLYASTRTLVAPIVAHATFNAINFTLYLVTTR
jgi:membrane protease YdiL (CAAX protease family)